jgi:hypothetical protein
MLRRIERQSNMRLARDDPPNRVSSTMTDAGTSTPFFAQLHLGILALRDQVFDNKADRDRFDTAYEAVLTSVTSAREAAHEAIDALREHTAKVQSGEIVQLRGNNLHVTQNVDRLLRREVDTFLNSSVRAMKDGLQHLLKRHGTEIGSCFSNRMRSKTD